MQGLLLQLSALDTDAASALRVIAFFDTLLERRASPRALVQATAGLAQCVVGWRNDDGVVIRLAPGPADNWRLAATPTPSHEADVPGHGVAWLERQGEPHAFDELVLERFALAAGALASRTWTGAASPRIDPGDVLLDPGATDAARREAARAAGLHIDQPVTVVAFTDCTRRDPVVWARGLAERCWPGDRVYIATRDGIAAIIVQQVLGHVSVDEPLRLQLGCKQAYRSPSEAGMRAGVGTTHPVETAHRSWQEARTAVRFAGATGIEAVSDFAKLGALRLLAQLPREALLADPDVQIVSALRSTPSGPDDVAVLQAFCRTGSLRQASLELHMHHSTVATHLSKISARTGWDLSTMSGRNAASSALIAEHLCR